MQRYVQGFQPTSFNDVWVTNAARRQDGNVELTLRNDQNLHIPFLRLSSRLSQPLVKLPRLWSEFNNLNVKHIRDKIVFNRDLKKHFCNELSNNINCNRLYCPACQHVPV
jgi:hypothetical protein